MTSGRKRIHVPRYESRSPDDYIYHRNSLKRLIDDAIGTRDGTVDNRVSMWKAYVELHICLQALKERKENQQA